jgi:hypothetical protein
VGGINRHGAEAARRAHNPEVTRSKRVVGIFNLAALKKLLGDIRPLVGLSDIKQSGYGLVVHFNAQLKCDRDSCSRVWGDQQSAICRDTSMVILITGSLIKSESDREILLIDLSNKYFPMDAILD